MAAVICQLRAAVTALLNAGVEAEAFDTEFTAVEAVVIDEKATSLEEVKVIVLGTREESDAAARDLAFDKLRIEVGILKRLDSNTLMQDTDALIELVEQVRNYLRNKFPAGYELEPGGIAIEPLYDHNRLRTKRLFASVIVCTYVVDEESIGEEVED